MRAGSLTAFLAHKLAWKEGKIMEIWKKCIWSGRIPHKGKYTMAFDFDYLLSDIPHCAICNYCVPEGLKLDLNHKNE